MIHETLVEIMAQEGPKLHTHAIPKAVIKNADDSLTLQLEDGRHLTVDCLIWAIGRVPATDNLNLAATGITLDEKGFIPTDKFQNTAVANLYAVGDNTGRIQLTPVAVAAGRRPRSGCSTTSRASTSTTIWCRPWCSATRPSAPSA